MISVEEYEGSADYQSLLVASTGRPERSMGDSVIPAEPPQWSEVRNIAKALLKSSPSHLGPLTLLIKAEANLNGFVAMQEAFSNTQTALNEEWDSMLPSADEDDPEDMFYARINLFRDLADDPQFIDDVYRVPLVDVKGIGSFSSRDIDIARGNMAGTAEEKERCQEGLIRGCFKETAPEDLQQALTALQTIAASCDEVEQLFTEKAGSYNSLSLSGLKNKISACESVFSEYAESHIEISTPADEAGDSQSSTGLSGSADLVAASTIELSGLLGSRADAEFAFDRVLEYYCHVEPSSPVGVLAQRAKGMVTKPFFAVLHELAPTERDNFSTMLSSLSENPTAYLLDDSYMRFLNGEVLPTPPDINVADNAPPPAMPQSMPDPIPEPASENHSDPQSGMPAEGVEQATAMQPSPPVQESPSPAVDTNSAQQGTPSIPKLQTRGDVIALLNEIEQYFMATEPSNPIPLVLVDMKRLVPKSFVELLSEFSRAQALRAQVEDVATE